MNVNFKQSNAANFKKGRSASIKYLVIHYTANHGDTAKNNADYFARERVGASAHYFVDENAVWQSVRDSDTAWHCGGGLQGSGGASFHKKCTNSNSIGIEICMNDRAGRVRQKSIENAAELTRNLMEHYGIDSSHVIRHWDVTSKSCPQPMIGNNNALWKQFKQMIEEDDMTEAEVRRIIRDEYEKIMAELKKKPASSWAAAEWAKAKAAGITDGTMPQAPLTREAYVVMESRKEK